MDSKQVGMNRTLTAPVDRWGNRQRPTRAALDAQLARVRADIGKRFQPMIDGMKRSQRDMLELMAHGLKPDEVTARLGIADGYICNNGILSGLYLGTTKADVAIMVAAWWGCRAARLEPSISDAAEHCGCADTCDGISDG